MTNVKIQMTNQIENPNDKQLENWPARLARSARELTLVSAREWWKSDKCQSPNYK